MMTEALDALHLQQGSTVVDATLGGGGYTHALFDIVKPRGRVIAMDADEGVIERFRATHSELSDVVTAVHSNYSHVRKVLTEHGLPTVDAIVADLGFSSDQIEDPERGFSFMSDGPLDMRMDQTQEEDAAMIVNHYKEDQLIEIFATYGGERYATRIARAIVRARPLTTTGALRTVIESEVGGFYRSQKIHSATRTFQALRIAVNDEYGHLKTFLTEGIDSLTSGGRMSIVSFHSGEDQIVKHLFRAHARGCVCPSEQPLCNCDHEPTVRVITKKPLLPTQQEVRGNPRARSARLRVVEKI